MTDHTEKNEDEHIILADEPLLKDSKAPSKLPWILAAVTIVLIVMSLQFGSRLLMHKLTQKKAGEACYEQAFHFCCSP